MKIYSIIVTFNAMRNDWINRCLSSLRDSTVKTIPIVVDNCSTDGTREFVPSQYPEVVWLPQNKNLGFGQANNIGIRYVLENNADYVLLLNQDASLHKETIRYMLEASDGTSLISPLHLNGKGSGFDNIFRLYSLPLNSGILEDLLINDSMAISYESGEICAACWFMPISIIEKIGGFNPIFFHYCEDNNYYHRMRYHGIKTLLVPRAKMFHDRVYYGNEQAFNHQQLKRQLTLIAYNINNSFSQCIKDFLKQLSICYRRKLLHGKYFPGSFLYEILMLLFKTNRILESRTKEKEKTKNWL